MADRRLRLLVTAGAAVAALLTLGSPRAAHAEHPHWNAGFAALLGYSSPTRQGLTGGIAYGLTLQARTGPAIAYGLELLTAQGGFTDRDGSVRHTVFMATASWIGEDATSLWHLGLQAGPVFRNVSLPGGSPAEDSSYGIGLGLQGAFLRKIDPAISVGPAFNWVAATLGVDSGYGAFSVLVPLRFSF